MWLVLSGWSWRGRLWVLHWTEWQVRRAKLPSILRRFGSGPGKHRHDRRNFERYVFDGSRLSVHFKKLTLFEFFDILCIFQSPLLNIIGVFFRCSHLRNHRQATAFILTAWIIFLRKDKLVVLPRLIQSWLLKYNYVFTLEQCRLLFFKPIILCWNAYAKGMKNVASSNKKAKVWSFCTIEIILAVKGISC